jgi:hypothetical protein
MKTDLQHLIKRATKEEKTSKLMPATLEGIFQVDFENLILKAINLQHSSPSDYKLYEIRFDSDGVCHAVFERGITIVLNMKFDEVETQYTFQYKGLQHAFIIRASLFGINEMTDIFTIIDFNQVLKGN